MERRDWRQTFASMGRLSDGSKSSVNEPVISDPKKREIFEAFQSGYIDYKQMQIELKELEL